MYLESLVSLKTEPLLARGPVQAQVAGPVH